MRRGILAAVIAVALGVPAFSHADDCVAATPQPAIPGGATTQSLDPVDPAGTAWVYTDQSSVVEVGAKGAHGYIVARGDANAQSASIRGFSNDVPVNGSANTSPAACISADGNKVTAP